MSRFLTLAALCLTLALAACGDDSATTAQSAKDKPAEMPTLTVMSHDSFSISKELVQRFEEEHGAKVAFLKTSGAGAGLNQCILAKGNPLADIFIGVDTTFLSRAIDADIFEAYNAPALADIPESLKLDSAHRLLPVSFGDVCLNYDKAWFAAKGLPAPTSLEDLTRPEYKGLTVVQNPATSSPGLSFLLATVGHFGEEGAFAFWQQLAQNDVKITDSWKNAYWGEFSAASDGTRPIVVSYASSPAAEVYYAEEKPDDAPTAAVLTAGSGFRQVEFAGILKGTKQRELAERFVDFLLSAEVQQDIPLQMWVYPANAKAELPEVFRAYAATLDAPATLSPKAIDEGRERFIQRWTTTVLR
ncbi:thiamine ABC transporter substrate-binding protein [Desulfobaculum senezii]|uniref:thiamine ABC transporter substrate-binding protein n=1 Tax=Desulfobaculum sp. SPO524 TaxID=3378071 RepID=UPI003852E536